ncbi:DNA repair protein rad16 [Ascosphaera acerosa]|nr:DNA repair protein rad16 [Ascosphaera acerosa]
MVAPGAGRKFSIEIPPRPGADAISSATATPDSSRPLARLLRSSNTSATATSSSTPAPAAQPSPLAPALAAARRMSRRWQERSRSPFALNSSSGVAPRQRPVRKRAAGLISADGDAPVVEISSDDDSDDEPLARKRARRQQSAAQPAPARGRTRSGVFLPLSGPDPGSSSQSFHYSQRRSQGADVDSASSISDPPDHVDELSEGLESIGGGAGWSSYDEDWLSELDDGSELDDLSDMEERAKLILQHPFVATLWEDLEKIPIIQPEAAPQPPGITRQLKPFQLEGLNWMIRQEASPWNGGLLGDEMGMGKTIQAVSLLMSDYPVGMPSLVVVPPVALMQWQSEIKSYTNDRMKVLIHHNSSTNTSKLSKEDLLSYDVIIISYSGLESLYRKQTKGWIRSGQPVLADSPIHAIEYHRLILDEAHNIKQRTTSVARACFALKARHKWCLSGTPVQNRIGEFFSLLRFLDVQPFACYLCKNCNCQTLQWSQDSHKRCTQCHHSGFSHVSLFNQEILNPLTHAEEISGRGAALAKLRLLTDRIMLRRVKQDHTQSMELPPKKIVLNQQFFGEIERDFSTSIMTNSTRQFETYVSRGVMLSNYANIFGLIMQMRQVANHPDLILKKRPEDNASVLVCCICDEVAEQPIRSRCHHEFCRLCVREYIDSCKDYGEPDCPRCHIPLVIDLEQPECEAIVDTKGPRTAARA